MTEEKYACSFEKWAHRLNKIVVFLNKSKSSCETKTEHRRDRHAALQYLRTQMNEKTNTNYAPILTLNYLKLNEIFVSGWNCLRKLNVMDKFDTKLIHDQNEFAKSQKLVPKML